MKQEYMSKQDGKLAEIYESIKNRMESQRDYIIYIYMKVSRTGLKK